MFKECYSIHKFGRPVSADFVAFSCLVLQTVWLAGELAAPMEFLVVRGRMVAAPSLGGDRLTGLSPTPLGGLPCVDCELGLYD